jgi:hypothetical protein
MSRLMNLSCKILFLFNFLLHSISIQAKIPNFTNKELQKPPSKVIRICCAFGSDLSVARIPFVKKNDITSIDNLGTHKYLGGHSEGLGIIYTKKGGFIDLGHLRDYADWTAYLYNQILLRKETGESLVLNLGVEGGMKNLELTVPNQQDSIYYYELAASIAYDLSVWHEIATWFGASTIPMVPERFSSFSPEDLYSNLLGIKLGIMAIKSELEYNEAMTKLLAETFKDLNSVASVQETYLAMEEVENIWWTRKKPIPSGKMLLKRYLGSETHLQPWLLPNDEIAHSANQLAKPNARLSGLYELSIKLNSKFPLKSLESAHVDRTINQKDFSWFIDYIQEDQINMEIRTASREQKSTERKDKRQHLAD